MELVCMGWDREHGRMKYVPVRVAAEIEAQQEREKEKAAVEAKEDFGWTASENSEKDMESKVVENAKTQQTAHVQTKSAADSAESKTAAPVHESSVAGAHASSGA